VTPAPSNAAVEALLPLLALCAFLFSTILVFGIRCALVGRPRTPYIASRSAPVVWKWFMEWWVWLWGPVERACVRLGIPPNAITIASAALAGVSAVLLASGRLSLGGWVYLLGSSLDLVDGRVARAQGSSSRAGAFLDSTLDRVAELLVFASLAVYFRHTAALYASLAAAGASVLVSYARARGEALGANGAAKVGGMQRAERVVLTGLPCALAPAFEAVFGAGAGARAVGSALALLAAVTSATALRRSYAIWRELRGPPSEPAFSNVRWLDPMRRRQKRPGS
jgi:phosphatidylinositol phosphate synthase